MYLDQLKFCVVCVDGLGYVYVVNDLSPLMSVMEPLPVCVLGVRVWWCSVVFLVS